MPASAIAARTAAATMLTWARVPISSGAGTGVKARPIARRFGTVAGACRSINPTGASRSTQNTV